MSHGVRARLRADLEAIVRGAIAAAAPGPLVTSALAREPLPERVHLLAIGKAALPMLHAALDVVGGRALAALAVAPAAGEEPRWTGPAPRVLRADHPVPGAASTVAAAAVRAFLEPLGEGDVALVLLSGGASALLTAPAPGLALEDLAQTTRLLLAAGADIHQLNCVRKHLDHAKGGRLAAVASPGRTLCLALSDVPGDDPAVIGSGPFTADPTTFADARAVLERHALLGRVPASVRAHLERAEHESLKPGDAALARVAVRVIGSNRTALAAAARLATERGYAVTIGDASLAGEARIVGGDVAHRLLDAAPGSALVFGGETTVTVVGGGQGGRSQELALAAAVVLAGHADVALCAAGTDGIDGRSPAAGGLVDGGTVERLRARGVAPERALALNDSYAALAAAGDALITGPTGTNVMDLVVALRAR